MRGGTGAIKAGFSVFSLIVAFIQFLFGLVDRKYLVFPWSLAFAISLTIPVILVLGVKKGIINFMALLVIILVMALIGT